MNADTVLDGILATLPSGGVEVATLQRFRDALASGGSLHVSLDLRHELQRRGRDAPETIDPRLSRQIVFAWPDLAPRTLVVVPPKAEPGSPFLATLELPPWTP